MKILSIETSCDETAVSIIDATGGVEQPNFRVLSNLVLSQMKLHEKYGGVFPSLAKREHSKNLVPLIKRALEESGLFVALGGHNVDHDNPLTSGIFDKLKSDLAHEPELFSSFIDLFSSAVRPDIDMIAVTFGPGLEPALWVGVNAAKALGEVWNIPVMPINHMEGHIASVLLENRVPIRFPALALLISGGHTELIKVSDWLQYEVIGETKDDAVGEAYDKVARMLGLMYPGGPRIEALAGEARRSLSIFSDSEKVYSMNKFYFPRPMLKSGDLNFSFSGLKTSVLYTIRDIPELTDDIKKLIALAFEDAVIETLISKTKMAINNHSPKILIIAGGVIANNTIRRSFEKLMTGFPQIKLLIPTLPLSTDNALMIALASYVRYQVARGIKERLCEIKAEGGARV